MANYHNVLHWNPVEFETGSSTGLLPSKKWDEITYPFPDFNGATVDVWEWISNFIPYFIMGVIIYQCWDLS